MRTRILVVTAIAMMLEVGCAQQNSNVRTSPIHLTAGEIDLLKKELEIQADHYDADKKMIWTVTKEKHYHSDLDSGVRVHDTRSSIQYAAALMRTADTANVQRGIDIIRAILPLQEKDISTSYSGVWPYYPEDPLKDRKAPVDHNWADFMSVSLIDIVLNSGDQLDAELKRQIQESLILASRAIMKRDVKADYTNICIMGTYVCYVVGNLYDKQDISAYGKNKLTYFYTYTKDSKGFTEYNSPTYTIVAMNELLRMKLAITNPADKKMVDELYDMCWSMIARHFHQPSGQWCGPNLRAYTDLMTPELKQLFYYASKGQIALPGDYPKEPRVLEPHVIPAAMIPMFKQQKLPRLETDTFTVGKYQVQNHASYADGELLAKDIVGKLYVHPQYALASVNQGYLWNQCRPLSVHWGTPEKPSYLRLRFLHDGYDFSAVHIKSVQDSVTVLSVLNVAYNGGDKHPSIDRIKDSAITATDIRIRFETGGDIASSDFSISTKNLNEILFSSGPVHVKMQVPYCNWDGLKGHWEVGGVGDKKWADFVIYTGNKKSFNLAAMKEAVIGLLLTTSVVDAVTTDLDDRYLRLSANHMAVKALKKPADEFRIRNDFETKKIF